MDGFLFPRRAAVFAAAALGLVASPAWAGSFPLVGTAGPMVIDPTTQSTIYVAFDSSASESDIYKSTDWGVTWTFSQALPYVADLEIDLQNHSILYASTAVPGAAVIFKSTDSGVTWSEDDSGIPVVSGEKGEIYLLAVDPVNEGVVYAAGKTSGLYKSTDGGQNWASIVGGIDTLTSENYDPEQIRVDPSHPSTVYFGIFAIPPIHGHAEPPVTVPTDIYKSTDGGATWNPTGSRFVSTTVDPANFSHLVACDGSTLQSSTDGGVTWVAGASCVGTPPTIVISDTNPNQIFVTRLASATVWGSTDGGATLNPLHTFPQEVTSIASRSGNVYVGAYNSGLYISRDSGATWSVSSSATVPQTINVPADQSTIQAAINAANSGDTVLVAPGTYYELLDFKGKAITLKSSGGATVTILDGQNSGPIVTFDTGEGNASVLQGFTLTHAYGAMGAAVVMSYASPTVEDDIFVDNTDADLGTSSAILGTSSSATILRNYFADNVGLNTEFSFDIVVSLSGGSPVVADNVFVNNTALACYIQMLPAGGTPEVYNNTMVGNTTALEVIVDDWGAGTTFSNNLMAFNLGVGVGMFIDAGSAQPPFSDNLIYGNAHGDYAGITSQTGVEGNISVDPMLKDRVVGDVHLLYGSPAIDTGDSTVSQASSTDFYGNTRVLAGNPGDSALVDIGAAEYEPPLVTATNGSASAVLNTATTGALGSSNADPGEPLVFALVTLPTHGTVALTNASTGAFRYVPTSGYIGSDSFMFHITDPYGTVSNTATEQVAVVDSAATANDGSVSTVPDTAVTGTLSATAGYAGQKFTFSLVANSAHGTVSLTPGSGKFSYTPATGYAGADSFTFEATDSFGIVSNVATESVTVTDRAPKAEAARILVMRNQLFKGTLWASTAYAGQVLSYSVVSGPSHGTLTITNAQTGAYTYKVDQSYKGKDSFTFQVVDQWGTASNVATGTVSAL